MADVSWQNEAATKVHVLQIITGAMLAGASTFLLIALVIGSQAKCPPSLMTPITLIAVAVAAAGVIARAAILGNITAKGRREIIQGTYQPIGGRQCGESTCNTLDASDPCRDAKYLLTVFQTRVILSAALFEGWTFFAIIAYLVEANPLAVGLAGFLVMGIAAHIPTASRAIHWVTWQLESVEQEKMLR